MGITVREKPKGSGRYVVFENSDGKTKEIKSLSLHSKEEVRAVKQHIEYMRRNLNIGYAKEVITQLMTKELL